MTQPAGNGPHPPKLHEVGPAGGPPAYGELYRPTADSAADAPWPQGAAEPVAGPRVDARALWWPAVTACAGIPVGFLWWLLAPGGLNLLSGNPALATGTNAEGWLPRDLVLAGLFLLAGCLTGFLLTGEGGSVPATARIVLAVLGGAVAAVISWQAGILAGHWWGAMEDTSANPSIAFSLRAYAVLAIWPAAVAAAVFFANLTGGSGKGQAPDE